MKGFLNVVAYLLVIIGALNWGLWGFFQFDLVAWLFHGNTNMMSRVIYAIIGLAGVWHLGCLGKCCKAMCCGSCSACGKCHKEGTCCSCGHNHKGDGSCSCGCPSKK